MRLISVEVEGYRRFESPAKVSCDGKLTALVGPNEAGKSSLLAAIERLNDDQPISALERTRGTRPADDAIAITALWLIEPADLDLIEIPPSSPAPRWLITEKSFDGERKLTLSPKLRRDRAPRRRLAKRITSSIDKPWFADLYDDEASRLEHGMMHSLVEGLSDQPPTLTPTTLDAMRTAASILDLHEVDAPKYARGLADELRAVAADEAEEHPTDAAIAQLASRVPRLLRFTPADRELESFYELNEVIAEPRPALTSLASLAGLDINGLRDGIATGDFGLVADLREKANAKLKEKINDAWAQSEVEPTLDNDDFVLRIFVRTGGGGLHDIAQRSQGLRAFIALVAFTAESVSQVPPILLVDEAEIHLHYDAQADLIQMFGHQQQAAQVIYTTHSAGCLPQDLGTGVRIVVADEDTGRSTVDNWPWQSEGGFGPLLLGMGASAMAFVPTRGAIIGEGAVEVVLMPALMREALGVDTLDYQVAPGASEASAKVAAHIDFQGRRVVWLVDGDEGGRANRAHLINSNIPADRIFTLGGEGSLLTTEDLVRPDVFVAGVNEELRRSHGEQVEPLEVTALPQTGRWQFVEQFCSDRDHKAPNKGAVAHRIADLRLDGPLLDRQHVVTLRTLHEQAEQAFEQ